MFHCAIGCEHIHMTTEVNLSVISITLTSKDYLSNQRSSQEKKKGCELQDLFNADSTCLDEKKMEL